MGGVGLRTCGWAGDVEGRTPTRWNRKAGVHQDPYEAGRDRAPPAVLSRGRGARSLDIEGVPQLIETNARHYKNHAFKLYAVSTYVPGKTRRELFAGSYRPEQAIGWTIALCAILRACREAGICHRDVKPENCILGDDGKFYLVDFGLSSNVNESDGLKRRWGRRSATGSSGCRSSVRRA